MQTADTQICFGFSADDNKALMSVKYIAREKKRPQKKKYEI